MQAGRAPGRHHRGFTLVELLVVILVLGILATIGMVAYDQVTARAREARALADLRQVATALLADATVNALPEMSRTETLDVMTSSGHVDVHDGLQAAGTWYLGHATDVPTHVDEYAAAFDSGDGAANDTSGPRAVLVTSAGDGSLYAALISLDAEAGASNPVGSIPAGTTPAAVLANPALISKGGHGGGGNAGAPGSGSGSAIWASGSIAQQKLWGQDETNNAWFGGSLSMSGSTLAVGAGSQDTAAGSSAGAVYIYTLANGTWTQQAELFAPTPVAYGGFGASVALSGNTLAVTSSDIPEKGDLPGVLLYTGSGSTWTLSEIITGPSSSTSFGYPVALDGQNLAIGAQNEDGVAPQAGAVYLYHHDTSGWVQESRLVAPDGAFVGDASEQFGWSLSLQGSTVAIGAQWKNNGDGAVYVADRTSSGTWSISHEFTASSTGSQLGRAVSYDNDHLVAAAHGGLVQLWTRTAGVWGSPVPLTASAPSNTFGTAVSLHGDTLAVTSSDQANPGATGPATQGVTSVFSLSGGTWQRVRDLYSADPNWAFGYGTSATVGDHAIAVDAAGGVGDNTKMLFSGHVTVTTAS